MRVLGLRQFGHGGSTLSYLLPARHYHHHPYHYCRPFVFIFQLLNQNIRREWYWQLSRTLPSFSVSSIFFMLFVPSFTVFFLLFSSSSRYGNFYVFLFSFSINLFSHFHLFFTLFLFLAEENVISYSVPHHVFFLAFLHLSIKWYKQPLSCLSPSPSSVTFTTKSSWRHTHNPPLACMSLSVTRPGYIFTPATHSILTATKKGRK